jgi:hypothetical protein
MPANVTDTQTSLYQPMGSCPASATRLSTTRSQAVTGSQSKQLCMHEICARKVPCPMCLYIPPVPCCIQCKLPPQTADTAAGHAFLRICLNTLPNSKEETDCMYCTWHEYLSSPALRSVLEPSLHLIRALSADQVLILAASRDTVALLPIPRSALIVEAGLALFSDTAALAELATVGGISHTESCICRHQLGVRVLGSLLHRFHRTYCQGTA